MFSFADDDVEPDKYVLLPPVFFYLGYKRGFGVELRDGCKKKHAVIGGGRFVWTWTAGKGSGGGRGGGQRGERPREGRSGNALLCIGLPQSRYLSQSTSNVRFLAVYFLWWVCLLQTAL